MIYYKKRFLQLVKNFLTFQIKRKVNLYYIRKDLLRPNMRIEEYVNRFKQKDYALFNEFYQLTYKKVYFTALAILKDKYLAEDIMQECFVAFLENIGSIKPEQNALAYLVTIARNKSINYYNKNKRLVLGDDEMKNIPVAMGDSGGVENILNLLPEQTDREIITYHVVMGYKFKEIAKMINKPLGTVLWRYNRALKILREKVNHYE